MTDASTLTGRRSLQQFVRFLIVGGTNTLLTYAIFTGLGLVIEPWIAYTIAFAIGLVWTSIGSSRFVFGAQFSLYRMLAFVGFYLVIYGIGSLIIRLVDPKTFQELLVTSIIMLATTTPLVFIVGRFIFNRPRTEPESTLTEKDRPR